MIQASAFTRLLHRKNLSQSESCRIFTDMFEGKLPQAEAKALLLLLAQKGETAAEVTGCVKALKRFEPAEKIPFPGIMDTAGTGGDGSHSINVSTLAAVVIAAAGGKVAKHGNRAVTSRCGSSDLMEAFGVNLDASFKAMSEAVEKCGLGYFHAPRHHPVFSRFQPLRRSLKTPTIFNLLGPLVNPVELDSQIIGVPNRRKLELYAEVLKRLKAKHAYVCSSRDGLDEISDSAPTDLIEIKNGKIKRFILHPEKLGLKSAGPPYKGKTVKDGKKIAVALLSGKESGRARNLVAINAAAGLILCGKAKDWKDGLRIAGNILATGAGLKILETLAKISHERS